MLYTALIVIHVLLAIGLIAVVLVQRGPGATMGAAFGAGASGTVFGSKGSASFLGKLTGWIGVAFFLISLSMAVLLARAGGSANSVDDLGVAERLVEMPELVIPSDGLIGESQESTDETFLTPPSDEAGAATEAPAVDVNEQEAQPDPQPESEQVPEQDPNQQGSR